MLIKSSLKKILSETLINLGRDISFQIKCAKFRMTSNNDESFICNLCNYNGPFMSSGELNSVFYRKYALCPKCGSMERQRLQYQVIKMLSINYDFSSMSILHIAPEKTLRKHFRKLFKIYHTGGLFMRGVNFNIDLRRIPFSDATYDCLFASHVLEHIKEDRQALSEISRILKPGGFAILPVPILETKTIEYPEPNPLEAGHVRAPGEDYYDRYREFFKKVEIYYSSDFPRNFQTNLYWHKTTFKHIDIVPVCYS